MRVDIKENKVEHSEVDTVDILMSGIEADRLSGVIGVTYRVMGGWRGQRENTEELRGFIEELSGLLPGGMAPSIEPALVLRIQESRHGIIDTIAADIKNNGRVAEAIKAIK